MEKAKHNTDAFEKWCIKTGHDSHYHEPHLKNLALLAWQASEANARAEAEEIVAGLLNVIGYLDTSLFGTGEGFTLEREAIAKAQSWQKREMV